MAENTRYGEIASVLRQRIKDGLYPAGTKLPGLTRLSREFGVSAITSNRALQELCEEGLIYRKERLGSFVAEKATKLRQLSIILSVNKTGDQEAFQEYLAGCLDRVADLKVQRTIHHQLEGDSLQQDWARNEACQGVISIGQAQYLAYGVATREQLPLVIVGTEEWPGKHFVVEDRMTCTRRVVETMIEEGLRCIAFVGGLSESNDRQCRDGYLAAVESLGLGHRLIRDANETSVGPVLIDLLSDDLGVDGVFVAGGRLPVTVYHLVKSLRPSVSVGLLTENPPIRELADACYCGTFSKKETGRMAVDLLCEVFAGDVDESVRRHPPFEVRRPSV